MIEDKKLLVEINDKLHNEMNNDLSDTISERVVIYKTLGNHECYKIAKMMFDKFGKERIRFWQSPKNENWNPIQQDRKSHLITIIPIEDMKMMYNKMITWNFLKSSILEYHNLDGMIEVTCEEAMLSDKW